MRNPKLPLSVALMLLSLPIAASAQDAYLCKQLDRIRAQENMPAIGAGLIIPDPGYPATAAQPFRFIMCASGVEKFGQPKNSNHVNVVPARVNLKTDHRSVNCPRDREREEESKPRAPLEHAAHPNLPGDCHAARFESLLRPAHGGRHDGAHCGLSSCPENRAIRSVGLNRRNYCATSTTVRSCCRPRHTVLGLWRNPTGPRR